MATSQPQLVQGHMLRNITLRFWGISIKLRPLLKAAFPYQFLL